MSDLIEVNKSIIDLSKTLGKQFKKLAESGLTEKGANKIFKAFKKEVFDEAGFKKKDADPKKGGGGIFNRVIGKYADHFGAVFGYKIIQAIQGQVEELDDFQKRSLALGKSLTSVYQNLDLNAQSIKAKFGAKAIVDVILSQMEAGFRVPLKGVSELLTFARATGQDFKELSSKLVSYQYGLGFSEVAISNLSETLLETSRRYGVRTQRLTDAIDGLQDTFKASTLFGGQAGFGKLVADLTGKLPGGVKEIEVLLRQLTDPAQLQKRMIAGIQGDANRILSGESNADDVLNIISRLSDFAEKQMKNFASLGVLDRATQLDAVERAFGGMVTQAFRMQQAINDGLREQKGVVRDYTATLQNFKETILSPLFELLSNVFHPIVWSLNEGVKLLRDVSNTWVKALGSLTISVALLAGTTKLMSKLQGGGALASAGFGGLKLLRFIPILGTAIAAFSLISSLIPGMADESKVTKVDVVRNTHADRKATNFATGQDRFSKSISQALAGEYEKAYGANSLQASNHRDIVSVLRESNEYLRHAAAALGALQDKGALSPDRTRR